MLRVNVWEKVLSLWGHKGIAFSGANLGLWAVPKRVIEEDCKVSSGHQEFSEPCGYKGEPLVLLRGSRTELSGSFSI